jgi:hypothetical protein
MYGKCVTLNLGEGYKVEVYVGGVPSLTETEWQERAWSALRRRMGAE